MTSPPLAAPTLAQLDLSTLVARPALPNDWPQLHALLLDDDISQGREHSDPQHPSYLAAFAAIQGDPNQLLVVGEHAQQPIAMLHLSFLPGLSHGGAWRALIESVRVTRARRGQGVGAWLIEHALTQAAERGCQVVQLTSDRRRTRAHAFYTRLGFEASHLGFKRKL